MFAGSSGSISRTVCTPALTTRARRKYVSRRPVPERELIARTPITTSVNMPVITSTNVRTCLKCGEFKKSSIVSCCAPGGAWYKNCGRAGNRNVDHRWFEGVKACKCKSKLISHRHPAVVPVEASSFDQCPHINTSAHDDDHRFLMPQMRHNREIWEG